MIKLLAKAIPDFELHSQLFESLGPLGYTVALNVRNVTPELYYSTFPAKWVERYTAQSFMMADPVVDFMFMGSGSTRWSEINHSRGPEKTAQFLEVSAAEGLKFGAAVVLRSHRDPTVRSLVSVCRSDRELADQEIEDLELSFLEMLRAIEFGDELTSRQIAVLSMMAAGSTRQECAKSLSVSPETIKRDADLARRFLGAKNVTEAVAIATARKIISIADAQAW